MKKNLIYLFCFSLLIFASCHNSNKKKEGQQDSTEHVGMNNPEEIQQISEIITRFVRAYVSQDNQKINALINPEVGIAIIHRPGASDDFRLEDSLDFKAPVPHFYPYETIQNDQVLTFEALPEYDCGTEKWSKIGFFCDTTASSLQKPLETIVKFQQEYDHIKLPEDQIQKIAKLENGAYRVILALKDNQLIFHVKKFNKGWFVTILDRAYASCDA